ncbi:hypothetical protein [Zavarzinella formosa]|uniref:hypothetical protein n=1 Tax=Zavarzinella formosa TaxID=360055 RepID=UPI0003143DA9|nr:hypothetical protein [Zavarzinella formosa]
MRPTGLKAVFWLLMIGTITQAAPGAKDTPTPVDESFNLIPAGSSVVLQLNGVERLKQRVNKMVENALPDQSKKIAAQLDTLIADALDGRDLKAIRGDARIYLAVTDLPKILEAPNVIVLLPIKDYDDFKKTFLRDDERKTLQKEKGLDAVSIENMTFFLAPLKGYVALSTDPENVKKIVDGKAGGLSAVMSKDTLQAFMNSDVSLFVNLKDINEKFGEQIKNYKMLAGTIFNNGGGLGVQGISKSQMDMMKAMIETVFQMVEDGVGFVLAIEARPEGVNLRLLEQFGEKTPTNEVLKTSKPDKLPELATLPGGQMGYSASRLNLKGSSAASMLASLVTADDEDEKVKEALGKITKEIAGYDQSLSLSANTALTSGTFAIVESKDDAKMLAAQVKLMNTLKAGSSFANVSLKDKPKVEEKALKAGPFELTKVVTKYDIDKSVAGLPEEARETAKASMKRALGGEELTTWMGAADGKFITLNAKEPADAKALVEKYLDSGKSVGKDEAFQTTRNQMPAEASWLMLLDGAQTAFGVFGMLKDTAGAVPGFPLAMPELKAPTGKPAYVGIALTLKPEHGSIDVFIPVKAVNEIRKFLGPIFNMDN